MKEKPKHETREGWLLAAVTEMTPHFEGVGYKVPKVRVSCGWPSSGGKGKRKRTLGECWPNSAAADNVSQIFLNPMDEDAVGEQGILSTLVHEVVHAVVGNKEKHNKVFGKCARAVGLAGKLTSTHATEELMGIFEKWMKNLGAYPHVALNPTLSPKKKQSTRMVKCECGPCGYSVRTSRKWLEHGAPICPCNKKPMNFTIPDELEGEDE